MTSTGSSESDGESAETWPYSASSTAVSSEDSEDRDFVVSDSEPLSFHDSRASSPDRNVPRSTCDNDDADPKPCLPTGPLIPIKVIAKRSAGCGGHHSAQYLVLWYSWEAADDALAAIEDLQENNI